jgi:transcriptional regulator with XRE-family HTH domain
MSSRTIRNLSLATLPLSGLWFLSNPDYEPAIAFISALAAALAASRVTENQTLKEVPLIAPEPVSSVSPSQLPERYSTTVGARLKFLREEVLELSLREMAEFLGIDVMSQLERYESGEDEYPLHFVKKIEEFFRISQRYVETGGGAIFSYFVLAQESVSSFVAAGYTPILACCPNQRNDLFCYQVFEKVTNGFTQIAFADRYGSFASSGGGKMNIGYLITALLDAGKTPTAVRILKATEGEWDSISNGSYYSKDPFHRFGCADWECMDIFDSWFDEYKKSRERWNAKAQPCGPPDAAR